MPNSSQTVGVNLRAGLPRSGIAGMVLLLVMLAQGCASPPQRPHPLPPDLGLKAETPGIAHARQWGDQVPAGFADWLALSDE